MGINLSKCDRQFQGKVLEAMGQTCEKKHKRIPGTKKMSKPEAVYYRDILQPLELIGEITHVKYEGISLRLDNKHSYKPDWTYLDKDMCRHCVEVKGSYKLPSERSARLAFDQAVLDFPDIHFLWTRQTKEGWEI